MNEHNSFTYDHATSPVYTFGSGPNCILVLHGWGSSIKSWEQLLNKIDTALYTVYFLELPGFGKSKEPNRGWHVEDYLTFVKKFVDTLKIKPDYLLVHSFGARIATKWLSQDTNAFKKAIYVGAAGIKPKLTFFQKFSKNVSPYFSKLSKLKGFSKTYKLCQKLLYKLLGSGDYLNVKGVMKSTFVNVIDEDLTNLLPKIKIPILLIWGEKDSYTPLWMGNLMQQKMQNADLLVIPDGKHGLHLQNPDLIIENIYQFFN